MFARLNQTVLKAIIIVAILLILGVLYTTGIAFVLRDYSPSNLLLHKLAALLIIALLGVHAWLRRCTIRKMIQECIAIVLNKHIHHEENIDFLIHNTKNQSFQELCTLFKCDVLFLQAKLLENHIVIDSVEDTLKTIAKHNDKDIFQILLLMIKLHVEKNNSSAMSIL